MVEDAGGGIDPILMLLQMCPLYVERDKTFSTDIHNFIKFPPPTLNTKAPSVIDWLIDQGC